MRVDVTEYGAGRPFLLLHGGAGPQSVAGFAELLAATGSRVIVPVHPGFGGTARPEHLDSMRGLALTYTRLLDELDLAGVTVIGNSIGGWIAAEMAIHASPRISRVVLVDAGGLQVAEHPAADFFSLTPDQVADMAYYEPERFRVDFAALPDQAKAAIAGNQAALRAYTAGGMTDPSLPGQLSTVRVPVLVVWGAADRIYPSSTARRSPRQYPERGSSCSTRPGTCRSWRRRRRCSRPSRSSPDERDPGHRPRRRRGGAVRPGQPADTRRRRHDRAPARGGRDRDRGRRAEHVHA